MLIWKNLFGKTYLVKLEKLNSKTNTVGNPFGKKSSNIFWGGRVESEGREGQGECESNMVCEAASRRY